MKPQFMLVALAGLVAASPVDLAKRQGSGDDLRNGDCQPVTFIFARGSTEPGLLGTIVGPPTCSELGDATEGVACQGVGPEYTAGIGDNMLPKGTSDEAIEEAQGLFELASTQCPETQIVAGGYSQGAAVMHGAIPGLSEEIKEQIKGVVLYGDTRNEQDGGQIPDFSPEKTLIICADGDLVCEGQLIVGPAHLTYGDNVPEAVEFLTGNLA